MLKRVLKILAISISCILAVIILFYIFVAIMVRVYKPQPPANAVSIYNTMQPTLSESGLYVLGNNWIRQNGYGLWEMYIEGNAFDRGVAAGKLSEQLVKYQEEVFVSQIDQVIPSKFYQHILLNIVAWFNRNLTRYVNPEFLQEIYGISLSASPDFDDYGPAYLRLLNYHAAHDIGHAMQNYYLVGCSSFATWNDHSKDSLLILGRNFDFYFGDDFAKNKIIEFVSPDSGYNFAFVTWGGMIGVISGMNTKGITITINAGTTSIASHTATPVTIVAREILQYAANIDEAIKIASSKSIFVSESFLVGSATDKKAVIIEKKPDSQDIVWPDSSALVCTNHFQGKEFLNQGSNIENRQNNATGYRFIRIVELMNNAGALDPIKAADILRDRKGIESENIGLGNEKLVNQLLAHHSIIFEPQKQIMWVSTRPTVMGPFLAYDLNKIFQLEKPLAKNRDINEQTLTIPADSFIYNPAYKNYLAFKSLSKNIREKIEAKTMIPDSVISVYLTLNPEYYETYVNLGDYYYGIGNLSEAYKQYKTGLSKETNNLKARNYIINQIDQCKN